MLSHLVFTMTLRIGVPVAYKGRAGKAALTADKGEVWCPALSTDFETEFFER